MPRKLKRPASKRPVAVKKAAPKKPTRPAKKKPTRKPVVPGDVVYGVPWVWAYVRETRLRLEIGLESIPEVEVDSGFQKEGYKIYLTLHEAMSSEDAGFYGEKGAYIGPSLPKRVVRIPWKEVPAKVKKTLLAWPKWDAKLSPERACFTEPDWTPKHTGGTPI